MQADNDQNKLLRLLSQKYCSLTHNKYITCTIYSNNKRESYLGSPFCSQESRLILLQLKQNVFFYLKITFFFIV